MLDIPLLADSWLNGATVGIAFWVCIMLMVVVPSVAYNWQKVREAEAHTSLKQEMVARGYSAAEILAVVNNTPKALRNSEPADLPPLQKARL